MVWLTLKRNLEGNFDRREVINVPLPTPLGPQTTKGNGGEGGEGEEEEREAV